MTNHLGNDTSLCVAQAQRMRFLARFFVRVPDEDFIQSLMDEQVLEAVAGCLSEAAQHELRELAETWGRDLDLQALKQDYWGLFEVPGPRYLAPYESVYRREGRDRRGRRVGRLHGPSTVAVQQAYAQAGMEVDPAFLDLPDHIGVEIAFLAYLHEAEGGSDAEAARTQREAFLRDHVSVWAPALAERLLSLARTPLYRAAARMLQTVFGENTSTGEGTESACHPADDTIE